MPTGDMRMRVLDQWGVPLMTDVIVETGGVSNTLIPLDGVGIVREVRIILSPVEEDE